MRESSEDEHLAAINARAWSLRRSDPHQAQYLAADIYKRTSVRGDVRAHSLLVLASCEIDRSEFARASAQLKEAEHIFRGVADEARLAGVAILQGIVTCRQGNYEAALAHLQRAVAKSKQAKRPDLEAQALMRTGEVYGYRSNFERSRILFGQAGTLMEHHGDALDRSELALLQSRTSRLVGDYSRALTQGLEALQAKRVLGDSLGEVYALNNLGLIFHDPHDSAQALTYYLEGLSRSEVLKDRRVRLALLGNLGELYGDMGDLDKALLYTQQSLELSEAIGSLHTVGISLEGLGILQARRGNLREALVFYHRALALQKQVEDIKGQASTQRQLANTYAMMVERVRALDYFEQSLALARQIEHRYTEAEVLNDLGTFYTESGQPQEAKRHLHNALELAQTMSLTKLVRDCSEALYRLYKAEGDVDRALVHLEQVYAASQKLTDEVSARRTQRLLAQFELERARQETEIERLRNVELAQANAQLEAKEQENDQLLAELRQQAYSDALTGLPNRRSFSESLEKSFVQATRYGRPLAVALADIDDFKRVNDRFSHAVGDAVLKIVATILAGAIREGDLLARVGGEEFAFVFPETVEEDALIVCERVCRSVAEYDWQLLDPKLQVTLSVGLTWDTGVANAEKMMAGADGRLYHAKRSGKNRVD